MTNLKNPQERLKRWLEQKTEFNNPVNGKKEKGTVLEKMDSIMIGKALDGDNTAYKIIKEAYEGKKGVTKSPMQQKDSEEDKAMPVLKPYKTG